VLFVKILLCGSTVH